MARWALWAPSGARLHGEGFFAEKEKGSRLPVAGEQDRPPGGSGSRHSGDAEGCSRWGLDAFLADAVSCLWKQITIWSGIIRPYAVGDLLSGVRTRLRTPGTCERRYRSDYAGNPDALGVVVGETAAPARGC